MTDAERISRVRSSTAVRLADRGQRLWALFGAVLGVMLVAAPGLTVLQRLTVGGLTVVFVLTAIAALRMSDRPLFARNTMVGVAVVLSLVGAIIIPELLIVMGLIALVSIACSTFLGGASEAGGVAVAWLSGLAIGELLAPPSAKVGWYVFAMFVFAAVSMIACVDALTHERRRVTENLMRLHAAMRAMTATPGLEPTLDSIVNSVGQAIGAVNTGIMLRREDHLVLAAPRGMESMWSEEQVANYTRRELALEGGSPLSVAIDTKAAVVVRDAVHDDRFPLWAKTWARAMRDFGIHSLAVVPLRLGDEVIGLLVANFTWKGAIDDDELSILEAYAEQAALLVVRAQAYEQQREAAERLAEADQLKSEFLAMVSHELRTPLTATKGFVDTVLLHWDKLDESRRRELLERASNNADDLTRLITQLLDFAKIDADRVEIRPQVVALHDVVGNITDGLAPVLAKHELVVDVDPTTRVVADPDAVGHVLTNLLSNAVKFSPEGSPLVVRSRADDREVVVSVADAGSGIPAEDLQRIFDRFYQSEQPWSSRRGTGIGLAIARKFVELHGGRIWAESELGEGATLSFTLPAALPVDEDGAPVADGFAGADADAQTVSPSSRRAG